MQISQPTQTPCIDQVLRPVLTNDALLIERRYAGHVPAGADGQISYHFPAPQSFRKSECSKHIQHRFPQSAPASQTIKSQDLDQWSRIFIALTEPINDRPSDLIPPRVWSKGTSKSRADNPPCIWSMPEQSTQPAIL